MHSKDILPLCIVLTFSLAGCVPKSYVTHPELNSQVNASTKVGIVIGAAKCFQVDAAGAATIHEEKTKVMRTCVEEGALKAFSESGYDARTLDSDDEDISQILNTYQSIHRNIRNHFPGSEEPVSDPVHFGNLAAFMNKHDIDVIAVIHAKGNTSSGGKKATKLGLFAASYALGYGVYDIDGGYIDLAFIGKSGRLLYYESRPMPTYDLTNAERSKDMLLYFLGHVKHKAQSS